MCRYNIAIDDAVMDEVRPSIANGMKEAAWVEMQVQMLFAQMAKKARASRNLGMNLSQRLRGIGHAPKDFDYKKEMEERL